MLLYLFLGTLALFWWLNRKREMKGLRQIPGPKGYPFFGNSFQLGERHHEQFNKWTEEFGEIYQIKLGSKVNIVISNQKMIKELFSNDPNYVGRPNFPLFGIYEDERLGIVNSEGELWEVHRRFLLRQLRDFGFGKKAMESLILEELTELLSTFKAGEGQPISDIKATFNVAVINALWAVISQQRYQHGDQKLLKLMENTNKAIASLFQSGGLVMLLFQLRNLFPELSGYKAFRQVFTDNRTFFEGIVEEHKKTFQEDNVRDFIDVYLAEVKKTTDPDSVFYGARAERQLVAILSDMFFAGTDTTSTTLSWAVLYLCKFPEVQRKFQKEIKKVTGNSRSVSLADRLNMPYTLALMEEILRYSSISPHGLQHRALEGKEFHGYYIPKDALIMPNMHHMHFDPKTWTDPKLFRPERFLLEDGLTFMKNENLLPFQVGRRQCPGETMARDTIFLYLTNILQRFEVALDPTLPEPSLEPLGILPLSPQPYSIVMKDKLGA